MKKPSESLAFKIVAVIFVVLVAGTVSYLMARAGAPQNVWLWRDVFGVEL
jgi:multisubunit Na+/H+ antiporter MnhG subunit